MERETGFEPATLCLGIRFDHVPLASTHVRRRIFCRAWRRFLGCPNIHRCPPLFPRLATVWLQCAAVVFVAKRAGLQYSRSMATPED